MKKTGVMGKVRDSCGRDTMSNTVDQSGSVGHSPNLASDRNSCTGNGDSARTILQAANKVDRNNVVVRAKYMVTLMPRWGGSEEEMRAFVEESRGEGLSAQRLGSLEGIILADQAQTEREEGDYASAERDYRKAMESGNDCLVCLAEVLTHEGKFAEAIPLYSRSLALYPSPARVRR